MIIMRYHMLIDVEDLHWEDTGKIERSGVITTDPFNSSPGGTPRDQHDEAEQSAGQRAEHDLRRGRRAAMGARFRIWFAGP